MIAYTDPGNGDMFNAYQFWGVVVFVATVALLLWAFSGRKKKS
jgi:type IV secretory pathway TrbL component